MGNVIGVGNDIIEISRIRQVISRYQEKFLNRVFTPEEQAYCLRFKDAAPSFAVRFAAKEAIVKALGTGFREGVHWLELRIENDSKGKPMVVLSPRLKQHFPDYRFLLSMSHCKEYALATVILTQENTDSTVGF